MPKIRNNTQGIDKEEFISFYKSHTNKETKIKFNIINNNDLRSIVKKFNLEYIKDFKGFKEILEEVNKEEFEYYYFNHSKEDTCSYFNIGNTVFNKLLHYFNISKPKSLQQELRKQTLLSNYGVENCSQIEGAQEKVKNTKFNIYGNSNYNNIEKQKQTCLYRYGDSNYRNIDKIKSTCLEKYGCEYTFKSPEIINKGNKSKLKRYGNDHYTNHEKAKQTCLKNMV